MRFLLQPGEARTYPAQGRFLYVVQAAGPVGFEVETQDEKKSEYTLAKSDQVEFPGRLQRVTLTNKHSAAQTIEVIEGEGIFHPNQDGQRVTLTGQDVLIEVTAPPGNPLAVQGPVTDAELRATALAVSGPVTDAELRATALAVSGPVTDAELRASALAVSGPVTDAELRASALAVKAKGYATATPGASVTNSGTIAANSNRARLMIKAPKTNTGILWTGTTGNGLAIEPGDLVTIETSAAITITATVATDQFTFLELE